MGAIIEKQDLMPKSMTTASQNMNGDLQGIHSTMKEFQGMINTIDGIVKNIVKLRGVAMDQSQPKGLTAQGLTGSAEQIKDNKINHIAPSVEAPRQIEQTPNINTSNEIKREVPKIDTSKINGLLFDLIVNQGQKIPEEIKKKTVQELTGENFTKFVYMWNGIVPVGHDMILDEMSKQVVEAIYKIQNEKEPETGPDQKQDNTQ